jgi:hypothetical protein
VLSMAKTIEETEEMAERRRKAEEVLRELRARPQGKKLTGDELMALISKMPGMPEGWTSADDIRDLRGPLPEDDPEYQRNILGRR